MVEGMAGDVMVVIASIVVADQEDDLEEDPIETNVM
jgi:hypothetical protein